MTKILEQLDEEQVYEAITEGVYRAIWRLATHATDMPCKDFYDSIKDGVKEAQEKLLD